MSYIDPTNKEVRQNVPYVKGQYMYYAEDVYLYRSPKASEPDVEPPSAFSNSSKWQIIRRERGRCWVCRHCDSEALRAALVVSERYPESDFRDLSSRNILQFSDLPHSGNAITLCDNCEAAFVGDTEPGSEGPAFIIIPEDLTPFMEFEKRDYRARKLDLRRRVREANAEGGLNSEDRVRERGGVRVKLTAKPRRAITRHDYPGKYLVWVRRDWVGKGTMQPWTFNKPAQRWRGWPAALVANTMHVVLSMPDDADAEGPGAEVEGRMKERLRELRDLWIRPEPTEDNCDEVTDGEDGASVDDYYGYGSDEEAHSDDSHKAQASRRRPKVRVVEDGDYYNVKLEEEPEAPRPEKGSHDKAQDPGWMLENPIAVETGTVPLEAEEQSRSAGDSAGPAKKRRRTTSAERTANFEDSEDERAIAGRHHPRGGTEVKDIVQLWVGELSPPPVGDSEEQRVGGLSPPPAGDAEEGKGQGTEEAVV